MLAIARPARCLVELGHVDRASALRPQHLGNSAERDQHRAESRGTDDDALVPLGEDGVIAVLAVHREALVAALEQTVDLFVAEIPAAIALAETAAESAHVADLRAGDLLGCHGQTWRDFLDARVRGDRCQFHPGPDHRGPRWRARDQ